MLATLAELGYGLAWRILDSRYFGVPQRRRRVFIVGARADGNPRAAAERAGAVLAVGTRCAGHPASGTEEGKDPAAPSPGRSHDGRVANPLGALADGGFRTTDVENATYIPELAKPLEASDANHSSTPRGDAGENLIGNQPERVHDVEGVAPPGLGPAGPMVAAPLEASDGHHGYSSPRGDGADNLVVPALTGGNGPNGPRSSASRLDNQTPLIAEAEVVPALTTRCGDTQDDQQTGQLVAGPLTGGAGGRGWSGDNGAGQGQDMIVEEVEVANTLKGQRGRAGGGIGPEETLLATPISADATRGEGEARTPSADAEGNVRLRDPGLGVGEPGDPAYTIAAASPGAVAAPLSAGGHPNSNVPGRRKEDDENLVPTALSFDAEFSNQAQPHELATLTRKLRRAVQTIASVRRLTPRECERLQGLPDDWTLLAPDSPDSRRYSGLGDAVTATVGRWLGERIAAADGEAG